MYSKSKLAAQILLHCERKKKKKYHKYSLITILDMVSTGLHFWLAQFLIQLNCAQ